MLTYLWTLSVHKLIKIGNLIYSFWIEFHTLWRKIHSFLISFHYIFVGVKFNIKNRCVAWWNCIWRIFFFMEWVVIEIVYPRARRWCFKKMEHILLGTCTLFKFRINILLIDVYLNINIFFFWFSCLKFHQMSRKIFYRYHFLLTFFC